MDNLPIADLMAAERDTCKVLGLWMIVRTTPVVSWPDRNISIDHKERLDARLSLMRSGLSVEQIFWLEVLKGS